VRYQERCPGRGRTLLKPRGHPSQRQRRVREGEPNCPLCSVIMAANVIAFKGQIAKIRFFVARAQGGWWASEHHAGGSIYPSTDLAARDITALRSGPPKPFGPMRQTSPDLAAHVHPDRPPLPKGNRSRVEGDKPTARHGTAKVLPRYIGRCDLGAERFDTNLLRCLGPERVTRRRGRIPFGLGEVIEKLGHFADAHLPWMALAVESGEAFPHIGHGRGRRLGVPLMACGVAQLVKKACRLYYGRRRLEKSAGAHGCPQGRTYQWG
jgi:hypothetical protein